VVLVSHIHIGVVMRHLKVDYSTTTSDGLLRVPVQAVSLEVGEIVACLDSVSPPIRFLAEVVTILDGGIALLKVPWTPVRSKS
jgi:hypothetical protein